MKKSETIRAEESLSEKYLGYLRTAYEDKVRRGLFEKYALYDAYWEGDVNQPASENDPGSSTNIIHANVEGQVSMLIEQNIGILPRPVTPADAPFADTVREVLTFIKDKNKMVRKLDMHERRREKYGVSILRVTFDPAALDGAGMPVIEACHPKNVFVDPGITYVYRLSEAEFIIETMVKTVHFAKEQYGEEIGSAIHAGYRPMYQGETMPDDTYLHMLVWTREGGVLRLVEMTGCGIILSDSFENGRESFYPGGTYPYFFTPLYCREESIWGKGDVELLIPVQDLINDLDDQIRLNARLTGNPQRLIEVSSGINLDALTNEAGLNIATTNVSAVRNLEAPPLPSYIMQRRDMAMRYESSRVTRFSEQMMGAKQSGVTSAAEATLLQQSGQAIIEYKKLLLQETLSEVFSLCLAMVREFWTREVAIRISGEKNDFVFFSGDILKNIPAGEEKVKDAAFDLVVTVGAGMPTNKVAVYQMMSDLCGRGIVSAEELRGFLTDYMGLPLLEAGENVQNAPEKVQMESPLAEGMTEKGYVKTAV